VSAGDTLVFTTFLAASKDEQHAAKLQDLRVPYWVCISQAMLVSAIALGFKLREWYSQIQSRVRTARDDGIEQAPTRHEALLAKIGEAKNTCIAHVIAVVVAVFEARRRRPIVLSTRVGLGLLPRPCAGHRRDWVQVNSAHRVGVAQDLPMGALTVTFAVRRYNIPDAVVLSLVTSSIMLGMKLAKLTMLKHWSPTQLESQICAAASLS
jgi:hypothetical protein